MLLGSMIGSLPLLLLWLVPGAVAALLLSLNAWTMHAHRAARHWDEVPCTIISRSFQRAGGAGTALELRYEYEYRGEKYVNDRLDLLPGRTGTDDRWERDLADRLPVGSKTVCYVDPVDPAESVLDRDRVLTNSRTLRLLAMPFLLAAIFLFGMQLYQVLHQYPEAMRELQGDKANERHEQVRAQSAAVRLGPAPRKVGMWTSLALFLGRPKPAIGAWLTLTACLMLFWMLDGPTFFAGWDTWLADRETGSGTVRRILPTENRELYVTMYEVTFDYEVDGTSHRGHGFVRGQQYQPGDEIKVLYDPVAPSEGMLPQARRSEVPAFLPLIFLAVALLVIAGLVANVLQNLRALRLLRYGTAAMATLVAVDDFRVYRFNVGTAEYHVRGLGEAMPTAGAARVTVLFDPARPDRNVIYDIISMALPGAAQGLLPQVTFGQLFPQILIPPVAIGLMGFFYWMSLPT